MKYVRYQSLDNSVGINEVLDDFWELDADGRVLRSIHVLPDGSHLKYSERLSADSLGASPEGSITDAMLADKSFGTITLISQATFEAKWAEEAKNA